MAEEKKEINFNISTGLGCLGASIALLVIWYGFFFREEVFELIREFAK